MTEPQRLRGRRGLADLLPATLATGVAGLVVSLVVGGTSAGIRSALSDVEGPVAAPSFVADAVADAGEGVTVRVQPRLPAPIAVTSVLDLLPAPADTPALARRTASAAPAATTAVGAGTPTAVAGVAVREPETAVLAAGDRAPSDDAPLEARAAKPKGRKASRSTSAAPTAAVVAAGSTRVALDGDDAVTGAPSKHERRGAKHEAPPPHAPAHGYRNR